MQNHTDQEPIDVTQTTTKDKERNIPLPDDNFIKDFLSVANEMLKSGSSQAKTIRSMLEHNIININERDKNGNTALHRAIRNNDERYVRELLNQFGVDVNIKNDTGDTPLHLAADTQNLEITRLLLDTKKPPTERGDVYARNSNGDTPFHIAARHSNKNICDHLQTMGAEWNIRNLDKKTVLDVAKDPKLKKHLSDKISKEQRTSDIISSFMTAFGAAVCFFTVATSLLLLTRIKSVESLIIIYTTTLLIALVILGVGTIIGFLSSETPPELKFNDSILTEPTISSLSKNTR